MPKILILDPIAQEGLDLLAKAAGIEHEVRTGLKGDALKKALAEFDGAICRSGVTITAESLSVVALALGAASERLYCPCRIICGHRPRWWNRQTRRLEGAVLARA